MNDLKKEFLEEKAKKLEKRALITKIEKFEKYITALDFFDRIRTYTWENELYQKISHFSEKIYAYKVDWDGKRIEYYIETEHEMSVSVRIDKNGNLKYWMANPTKNAAFIKEIYEILKNFIETKKEYRLRLLTGATKVSMEELLQQILSKEDS